MNKEIAFKCLECGTINVYPDKRGDGNSCIKCGGIITPIGEAVVYQPRLTHQSSKKNEISINIKVDTPELKELDRLAIGGRLYDLLKWSDDKINFSTILDFDKDAKEIVIKESDLLRAIQLVNAGQPDRHIRLIKE